MKLFAVKELIEMAVKDEETGIAFYQALAETTRSREVREACAAISKQEELHAERFRKMLPELEDYRAREEYPSQNEEYVEALLESRAFPMPGTAADRARAVGNDAEALDIAIRMEKDTLLFLQEMRSLVPEKQVQYVEAVIEEERGHVMDLTQLMQSLR